MKAILCFGDSITFGVGEKPAKGWCGRLKDYFEPQGRYHHVVNLGFPGHTSQDLLNRIESELKTRVRIKRNSDEFLTTVAIGMNDCRFDDTDAKVPRMELKEFNKNISQIISLIQKFPTKILFLGLTPVDEKRTNPFESETSFKNQRIKLFNDIVKEECSKNKILFLEFFKLLINKNYQDLLKDGLHPNSKGYDIISKEIINSIKKDKLI